MRAPRIAIVGARRVRQGLGPFVTRHLVSLGAEVPAFLGTSASTIDVAARELEDTVGLRPSGYTSLRDLLAREEVDALAILSPAETHGHYLEAALQAGLHVLSEKPLLWGGEGLAARAHQLSEGFAARGLLLAENCQWPYTLDAFAELHPGALSGPTEAFAMRLSPASRGAQMIGDALPHPLSVLQQLEPSPSAQLARIRLSSRAADAPELCVEFEYVAPSRVVPCRVELIHGDTLPREASLSINGRRARRRVRMEDYAQYLEDPERRDGEQTHEVRLPDPLTALLQDFITDLRARITRSTIDTRATTTSSSPPWHLPYRIPQRQAMLEALLDEFQAP